MGDCPTIKISNGFVKGKVLKAVDPTAKEVFTYLGIQYGKPPKGNLRFAAPKRAEPWGGVFNAVQTPINCPQDISVGERYDKMIPYKNELGHDATLHDEDCLRLNVFTSKCDKNINMPVMVWLSGGHYQRHYGSRRNGSALAGMNDVVVVVPNFRVNAFGFLSLGKGSCCSGNMAIQDVILALEWIKDNISAFGGDPNNVTVFGESSGSGMVHVLLMSPLSKGLFHKAIMQSGALLTPFLFSEDPTKTRDEFLQQLELDVTMDDALILQKLQAMPAEKIMNAQKTIKGPNVFMPTIDGHVINDTPSNLTKSGHVHQIPLLIGCTNSEGSGILSMAEFPNYVTGFSEDDAKKVFTDVFAMAYKSDKGDAAFELAKKLYLNSENINDPLRYSQFHGEMLSDSTFVVPTVLTATAHATMGLPTYLYQMTQQPEFNYSKDNGPNVIKRPNFVKCDHANDLHFVWGEPFEDSKLSGEAYFTEDEIALSRNVMKYFTNFAKSGNPNKPTEVPTQWTAYSPSSGRTHMVLKSPLETSSNLGLDKVVFFTQELPKLAMS